MKRICLLLTAIALLASLAGCGGGEKPPVHLDMNATYTSISQAVQMPEMLELPADLILDYCGIRQETVKQAKVFICADSLRTDEIWLIEAVDETAAKTVTDLANKRLQKKGEESITYSPEQYAVVQKAQLLQQGNYVALFVSPDVDAMANHFRSEAGME